jgi:hypothetical protein
VKKQTPKKIKLIRDSSIPETDYVLFATLKQRALAAGIDVKKSEVLCAALARWPSLPPPSGRGSRPRRPGRTMR